MTGTDTPKPIMQDFVFRMNQMLANLVTNEEENKIREQYKAVKAKYEKEELALSRMKNDYIEAGFSNPKAYKSRNVYLDELYELERRVIALDNINKKLQLIARMKEDFGEQSVLVPTEDFYEILSKYNLVSGRLYEYCGTVPFDKLANIARIRSRIMSSTYWRTNVQKYKKTTRYLLFSEERSDDLLFIAAPQECFKNNPKELDPLVCCLTELGVMVLEAWDIEAQDKTLAYYREQESLVSLATMHNKKSILNKLINKIKTQMCYEAIKNFSSIWQIQEP